MTQLTFEQINEIYKDIQPHIVEAFLKFDEENPRIFNLFRRFSYDILHSGKKQYGAKAIMERIRWHIDIETLSAEEFKINNNYTSCYARKLSNELPVFKNFFEMRSGL